MSTFRMGGAPPGGVCPTCSYPHFPFCMRQPPPNGASALPPLPGGSFPPSGIPSRVSGGRPPIHPPQQIPLPQSSLLGPSSAMATYQPSIRGQPFSGRGGAVPDAVPLVGRGSHPFHNQHQEDSFQNSMQPQPVNSRLSTPPNHLPPSVEHFPAPGMSSAPHSGLLANSRVPSGNGWPEDGDRDKYLLREKRPSMPQWFLDQQRRSGSKGGVAPNGMRNGIGELLLGEEILHAPYFASDAPGPRALPNQQGRLERDRREGVFGSEDVLQDAQQLSGYRGFREEMLPSKFLDRGDSKNNYPGLFHRMDVPGPGNGGLSDSELDREGRIWAMDTARDSSVDQGPFSTHSLGNAWRGSAGFGRDVAGGGVSGAKHLVGRRERTDEGAWPQHSNLPSSREQELLREHGLVDGAEDRGEWHGGRASGRGRTEAPDGNGQMVHLAPRRAQKIEGGNEHMGAAATGTEKIASHPSRQQVRPVNADHRHGVGGLVPPEISPAHREMAIFENPGSGAGLNQRGNDPEANVDTSKYGGQSKQSFNSTSPVQEELDELYYLKHFPQSNDNRDGLAISHPSAPVPPFPPPNRVGLINDGPPFQESLSRVVSHTRANEQRPAGFQHSGHVLPDRGHHQKALQQSTQTPFPFVAPSQAQMQTAHLQQAAPSHRRDRSPPQAHGVHPSQLTARHSFQQDVQLPAPSHPQHQPSPLPTNHLVSDLGKQPPTTGPSHTPQVSNGVQGAQSSQPGQMQQQQHGLFHLAPQLIQPPMPLPPHPHTQRLPQSQGLQHQIQQLGATGPTHPTSFDHNSQGTYLSFSNGEAAVNGRTMEMVPGSAQVLGFPNIAHQRPFASLEAPPLPLNAADAPPPPPPSPPHCQPPPPFPPMAPPPPPPLLPPPLPPSPPPVLSSGLTHPPPPGLLPPFPGHPHHVDELSHRLNYAHPAQPIQHAVPAVPHGPSFQNMGPRYMHPPVYGEFRNHGQVFPQQLPQNQEKSKVVNAVSIFRRPGRLTRPDRIVVILRGLPGSGKSYLAKALRDVELMNGGTAPRIHSIDDYFMSEVEMIEGEEGGAPPSSSGRGKKRVVKKVMEYCYEPEMEEVYRGSMLKAFRKTLEEGMFSFVIVDDRNVLVADFAQFWAIAKRSGYEVYLLEPPYKDPAGCAARNVHNFKQEQIMKMAKSWESAPPMYLQLDVSVRSSLWPYQSYGGDLKFSLEVKFCNRRIVREKTCGDSNFRLDLQSLFRGDDLNSQDITEVEMDTDDIEREGEDKEEEYQPVEYRSSTSELFEENDGKPATPGDRWDDSDGEAEEPVKPVKRMRFSEAPKDNSDSSGSSSGQGPGNDALSGIMQAYGRREKSVRWADYQDDEEGGTGFSIGSALEKISDLVIGPGPGYNKASNPVKTEDRGLPDENGHLNQSSKFLEQYRAEQAAFKAVFANRLKGGREPDDEDGAV